MPQDLRVLAGLSVKVVRDRAHGRLWNPLADEYPSGLTTFAGCQMRCLVHADSGWLGAVGYSASASRHATDGWRELARSRIVCMSRLLIRPAVRCAHLASRVCGIVLRRLPVDFVRAHGDRPGWSTR